MATIVIHWHNGVISDADSGADGSSMGLTKTNREMVTMVTMVLISTLTQTITQTDCAKFLVMSDQNLTSDTTF